MNVTIPAGRPVYIWGASWLGIAFLKYLTSRLGHKVEAFIDNDANLAGQKVAGLPVLTSGNFFENIPSGAFVVLASIQYAKDMAAELTAHGLLEGLDFIAAGRLRPHSYCLEVAGVCNLRCPSCACGNSPRRAGDCLMKLGDCEKALDKIVREDPLAHNISLYNWGEPFLHPELPRIIEMCNDRGFETLLSSNLNIDRNLEEVVKASPAWFKVSLSGYGPSYERTHAGGRWETLLANLKKLAALREKHSPEMQVDVGYHVYTHNCLEERDQMRELVRSLGFTFRETLAFIFPLDILAAYVSGAPLPPKAEEVSKMLLLPLSEGLKMVQAEADVPCGDMDKIIVAWDMTVQPCCTWFAPGAYAADWKYESFLSAPAAHFKKARTESGLCRSCMKMGLHHWLDLYARKDLLEERLKLFREARV
ncbi:hypothetical protein C4J81_18650 (plasmid) [Deltaproteobacteria bacterium Smac51]|nr:hypothetical protein C4J81_18650 [Deltaproteobacteria bacterium Smac51]